MKSDKTQIGFVGCGGWARKKYLPYLASLSDVCVVAMSNLVSDSEKQAVKQIFPEIQFFDTLTAMIVGTHLDAVIMSLPHAHYFPNITTALNAKIPVLADKPASVSFSEIKNLVNLAEKQGVTLAVSSQRRSFPGVIKARSLISNRELGHLHWLRHDFLVSSYPHWQKTWRNNPVLSGVKTKKQGILLDTGFHCVDSLLYCLNYQLPIRVFVQASYQNSLVETDVMVVLEFADELMASILISRNMPIGYGREVVVVSGEKGYFSSQIEEKDKRKEAWMILATDYQVVTETFETKQAVIHPLTSFLKHLRGQPMDETYLGKNILPTMLVMDGLYQSILTRQQVVLGDQALNQD